MENWVGFNTLRLAVSLLELISVLSLGGSVNSQRQRIEPTHPMSQATVIGEPSSVQCTLQGTPRVPAFSKNGDFVIGGIFSIHYKFYTVIYSYTSQPDPPRCTGRLVRRGKESWRCKKKKCEDVPLPLLLNVLGKYF